MHVYNLDALKLHASLPPPPGHRAWPPVSAVAFSADGVLALALRDNAVVAYDAERAKVAPWSAAAAADAETTNALASMPGQICALSFDPTPGSSVLLAQTPAAIARLDLAAKPDAARAGGQMPAHRCAAFDLTPMLALLGEFGAEVDREDDEGYAPAHVCAAWGKTSALEWLLTRGAVHVERLHGNGMTLSMFAAVNGHLETLKCLRRLGADVRRPCFVDHDLIAGQRVQCTIMAMACYEGRDHVVKWLVDDCDVGKCESEIVVVDPAYIDEVTAREREAERRAKEELTAQRARDAKKKNPYGRPYGPYGKPARRPSPPAEPPAAVDMSVVPDAAHPEAELLDAFAPAAATDNVDITVDDAADTPPHD